MNPQDKIDQVVSYLKKERLVDSSLVPTGKIKHHWHRISGNETPPEDVCIICGHKSRTLDNGLPKIITPRLYEKGHCNQKTGFYRTKEGDISVCETCDRIIHNILGAVDEL